MKTMKKTYQAPALSILELESCYTLQATSCLDDFGGSGGSGSGKDADARRYGVSWDDNEDDEY